VISSPSSLHKLSFFNLIHIIIIATFVPYGFNDTRSYVRSASLVDEFIELAALICSLDCIIAYRKKFSLRVFRGTRTQTNLLHVACLFNTQSISKILDQLRIAHDMT
jgi:hypothetical protein